MTDNPIVVLCTYINKSVLSGSMKFISQLMVYKTAKHLRDPNVEPSVAPVSSQSLIQTHFLALMRLELKMEVQLGCY